MFDKLEALAAPKASDLRSEIDRYLSTDVEDVRDAVMWWSERKSMFPMLSRMALDYLTIPGKSFSPLSFPTVVTDILSNLSRCRTGIQPWQAGT
jgi:hypothetical protein